MLSQSRRVVIHEISQCKALSFLAVGACARADGLFCDLTLATRCRPVATNDREIIVFRQTSRL